MEPEATTNNSNRAVFYSNSKDAIAIEFLALDTEDDTQIGFSLGCLHFGAAAHKDDGRFVVPEHLKLFAVFGRIQFDLSRAIFVHKRTKITCLVICGHIQITLPRGVEIQTKNGCMVAGAFQSPPDVESNALQPVVSIDGFVLCGIASTQSNDNAPQLLVI